MKALALGDLFFLPRGTPAREPSFGAACLLAILLFLVTRAAVLGIYEARHFDLLVSDPGNYVQISDHLSVQHRLPDDGSIESRQFPGLAILMALAKPFFGTSERAGWALSWLASLASIVLFHALFRNFRTTLLYTVFVPSWVASSTLIMSEGLTFLLLLAAIWAVHREERLARRLLLLAVAGFVLVVRNTAVFFLAPFLLAWWWENERGRFGRLLAYGIAAFLLPLAYLAWNWVTLHDLFPQQKGQLAYFLYTADGGYPPRLLAWPGQSLFHGLALAGIPLAKKLSVAASLLLAIGVAVRYFADRNAAPGLSRPFAWACAAHLLFHLSIGGSFGFSSFDRYVSHVDPLLAKGVAGERSLRLGWIVLAAAVGVLFAGMTGHSPGASSILPFIKPEGP